MKMRKDREINIARDNVRHQLQNWIMRDEPLMTFNEHLQDMSAVDSYAHKKNLYPGYVEAIATSLNSYVISNVNYYVNTFCTSSGMFSKFVDNHQLRVNTSNRQSAWVVEKDPTYEDDMLKNIGNTPAIEFIGYIHHDIRIAQEQLYTRESQKLYSPQPLVMSMSEFIDEYSVLDRDLIPMADFMDLCLDAYNENIMGKDFIVNVYVNRHYYHYLFTLVDNDFDRFADLLMSVKTWNVRNPKDDVLSRKIYDVFLSARGNDIPASLLCAMNGVENLERSPYAD